MEGMICVSDNRCASSASTRKPATPPATHTTCRRGTETGKGERDTNPNTKNTTLQSISYLRHRLFPLHELLCTYCSSATSIAGSLALSVVHNGLLVSGRMHLKEPFKNGTVQLRSCDAIGLQMQPPKVAAPVMGHNQCVETVVEAVSHTLDIF